MPDPRDRRRRRYAEYDPFKAQDAINENNANKGTGMLVTNQMAVLFRRHVIDEKLSPYDALCHMKEEMPGRRIPCLSTWYRHVNAGDVGGLHGQTPCHPGKRPRGPRLHPAMTAPGRLVLDDRPAGATKRSRFGHYEMDTVVSSTNGTGGLLVLVDRKSRRHVIEKLEHVTQDEVVKALKRMTKRKAIGKARSVTTDNGCEFLDPQEDKGRRRVQRLLHARLRLLGKGVRRELQPLRPQVVPEGNRLRQVPASGHAQARARHQLNPPQAPRRACGLPIRHRLRQGGIKETTKLECSNCCRGPLDPSSEN